MIFAVPRQLITRMSVDKANCRMIGALIACVLCCSSCDVPLETPFTKHNVAWSAYPRTAYNLDFKGWYRTSQGRRLAVLRWQGRGELFGEGTIIILCLGDAMQGSNAACRLEEGLLVRMALAEITFMQALDNQSFSCELLTRRSTRVSYESRVPFVIKQGSLCEPRYLRFSIVANEDDRRTLAVLRELYPQLKEREEARAVVTCIEPFLAERD